jgi:hypothetical protein
MSDKQLARASLATSMAVVANASELASEIVNSIAGGEEISNYIDGEQLTGDVVKQAVQNRLYNNLKAKGAL